MRLWFRVLFASFTSLALLSACEDTEAPADNTAGTAGSAGSGGSQDAGPTPNPFQEVADLGATRYLDKIKPKKHEDMGDGVMAYTFDTDDGPSCLHGDTFSVSIRDQKSDDLVIFLQGGGACWSDFCLAVTAAPPGIPGLDALNTAKETNPLKDMSHVYLPYCDGSLFAGSTEHDSDGDGKFDGDKDRIQHGLMNLSASLDIAADKFPTPKRIILAGSSGGSYGTIMATILVRTRYPDVELFVFEDSGVGLGKPGEPAFVQKLVDEFGVTPWLPPSCEGCLDNAHITRLIDWELEHDPKLTIGVFSSYEDLVLSEIFLKITGPEYHDALIAETDKLSKKYPDRYKRFFIKGNSHTALLGKYEGIVGTNLSTVELPSDVGSKLLQVQLSSMDFPKVQGVSVGQWFGYMIDHDPRWVDIMELFAVAVANHPPGHVVIKPPSPTSTQLKSPQIAIERQSHDGVSPQIGGSGKHS